MLPYIQSRPMAFLVVALTLSLAVACGAASDDSVDPACTGLEKVADRTALISLSDANELAVERLSMSAPEVTGMEIERVTGSCLTTYGSYQRALLKGRAWSNPDIRPPDTPVWIVEVKGISRPAGIATARAHIPYRYAMHVLNARTGEAMEGARYQEPRLRSAQEK